jgi:hypothetical protein
MFVRKMGWVSGRGERQRLRKGREAVGKPRLSSYDKRPTTRPALWLGGSVQRGAEKAGDGGDVGIDVDEKRNVGERMRDTLTTTPEKCDGFSQCVAVLSHSNCGTVTLFFLLSELNHIRRRGPRPSY